MTSNRGLFYARKLVRNVFSLKGISALLSSFGTLWLCVEIADYFFKDTFLPSAIQNLWWMFLFFGVIIALWTCKPILSSTARLKNRDVAIEIVIGDLFSYDGAIIVGSNTTFDTRIDRSLISKDSIQGQFTKWYYGVDEIQLDKELNATLNGMAHKLLDGKRVGKVKQYPIGTVVKLTPKERTGYFLAIANINEHGNASGTFEDLKQSLAELWLFILSQGSKEPLVIPVLGSGFTRLNTPRHLIVQEIIKSFIAACAERTICDKLTIVLSEKDVIENQIDYDALRAYLHHVCTYAEFAVNNGSQVGTSVSSR